MPKTKKNKYLKILLDDDNATRYKINDWFYDLNIEINYKHLCYNKNLNIMKFLYDELQKDTSLCDKYCWKKIACTNHKYAAYMILKNIEKVDMIYVIQNSNFLLTNAIIDFLNKQQTRQYVIDDTNIGKKIKKHISANQNEYILNYLFQSKNEFFIDYDILSNNTNDVAVEYLIQIENLHKINWDIFSSNTNVKAINFLMKQSNRHNINICNFSKHSDENVYLFIINNNLSIPWEIFCVNSHPIIVQHILNNKDKIVLEYLALNTHSVIVNYIKDLILKNEIKNDNHNLTLYEKIPSISKFWANLCINTNIKTIEIIEKYDNLNYWMLSSQNTLYAKNKINDKWLEFKEHPDTFFSIIINKYLEKYIFKLETLYNNIDSDIYVQEHNDYIFKNNSTYFDNIQYVLKDIIDIDEILMNPLHIEFIIQFFQHKNNPFFEMKERHKFYSLFYNPAIIECCN